MTPVLVDTGTSRKVLTVGEYYKDKAHGGIASVLQYYSCFFADFQFIPSSRTRSLADKLNYDFGSLIRLWWRLLWKREIRIVHIHTAAGRSFPKHLHYARLARLMGRKVILHCHASRFKVWFESLSPCRQRCVVRQIEKLDRLIVLSSSWKGYFEGIGITPSRISILNNITPHPAADVPGRSAEGPLRLLFLGEIGPRKGVFDLLKAMSVLKEKHPGAVMLDIGGNKNEEMLRQQIESEGLSDCVRFHGFVAGEQKQRLLAQADIFVLPSFNEGLPIAILEAMSYGCAIVSTPVGGIPEVVRQNGILVTPGDVSAIAGAIESMMEPGTVARMGEVSREIVKDYYPEAVFSSLLDIYSSFY